MQQIKFIECPSEVPVVKFTLDNGAVGFGVVDTASETTVFDMDFVQENADVFHIRTTDEVTNIVGINNNKPVPMNSVVTDVTIGGKAYKMEGMAFAVRHLSEHFKLMYDMDLNMEIIIGSDFLKLHNAKIDFEEQILVLDDLSGQ